MRASFVLVAVLVGAAAGFALADEPAPVDASASSFACDGATLAKQARCYLEGEVLPSHEADKQARTNVEAAAALAEASCREAATVRGEPAPDAELVKVCVQDFQAAAKEACSLDGKTPIFDEKGRFAPGARDCYDRLGAAVRRTRTMAAVTVSCCRCLEKKCAALTAPVCHHDLFDGIPEPDTKPCLAKGACTDECGNIVGHPAPAPADDSLAPRTPPAGGWY